MKRVLSRLVLLGLALAAAGSAPASAERLYDAEVKRLIEYANRGISDFRRSARSDFKNAKITHSDGVQVDVSNYLKDMTDSGKKLESRYTANYAAIPEATDLLKRFRTADDFAQRNPGISGAKSEWELLRKNMDPLAKAFNVDWTADPTTWQPARTTDGPIRAEAASLEAQAKSFRKGVDTAAKTAGLDKARRKVLEGESESLIGAAGALRKTIEDGRPASSALDRVTAAMGALGTQVQTAGLGDAVSGAWSGIDGAAKKLAEMIAGP